MNFDFLTNFAGSELGKRLIAGGIGAGLGAAFAPKAPHYQAPTAQQLNAAVIPEMRHSANLRMAHLLGAQGFKGGRNSSDTLEAAQLNQELSRGIGTQQAMNQIQATNYHNTVANMNDQANRQRYRDIIGAGLSGASFAPHTPSADEQQAAKMRQQSMKLNNQYMKMLIQNLEGQQQQSQGYGTPGSFYSPYIGGNHA